MYAPSHGRTCIERGGLGEIERERERESVEEIHVNEKTVRVHVWLCIVRFPIRTLFGSAEGMDHAVKKRQRLFTTVNSVDLHLEPSAKGRKMPACT